MGEQGNRQIASLIGGIGAYEPNEESWSSYIERFEMFIDCNEIPDTKRVSTLLTVVGVKTYSLLRDLCTPAAPGTKTYVQLVTMVKNHLHPKPSIIAERYKFSQRKQGENESIAEYLTSLRKASAYCEFGANLNDQLRDKLVSGIRSDRIRQILMAESDLTLEIALKKAVAQEAAVRDANLLGGERAKLQYTSQKSQGKNKQQKKNSQQQAAGSSKPQDKPACSGCGRRNHVFADCKYKEYTCNGCGKVGHLRYVCPDQNKPAKTGKSSSARTTHHYVEDCEESAEGEEQYGALFKITEDDDNRTDTIKVNVEVEEKMLAMEVDTGSSISAISDTLYKGNYSNLVLEPTSLVLQSYTGEPIVPKGLIKVKVAYGKRTESLKLYVFEKGGPPLLGRDWLQKLGVKIPIPRLQILQPDEKVASLINKFPDVFAEGIGTYKGGKIKLVVKEDAKPKFFKPRPIPFALKDKVGAELDRLVDQQILTPVNSSEWGTPVVPVLKNDGSIRVCGDYKVTLNPVLEVDRYPLPRIEELFTQLQGGEKYSKIDLQQAYQQVLLEDESKKFVTISTHKGLFQYNRIPYGISSAPGLFQRMMEQLLQNIPGVVVFLDDILVTGKDDNEHVKRLEQVFERLQINGLKVKNSKCNFFQDSIAYLGYVIDKEGLHTAKDKVETIMKAPEPTDITQLRGFLGLVNYYGKFVPKLSEVLRPLYYLLRKDVPFKFDEAETGGQT